jgi:maleate cis-trans isomerase
MVTSFDPDKPDCLAPYINKSNEEVREFLERLGPEIGRQGEYDQEDRAVLAWDDAMDLLTIARLTWTYLAGRE